MCQSERLWRLKVWIDILTPKQLLFFRPLAEALRDKCDVMATTRRYRELDGLADVLKFQATVVGRHGGASLQGKLQASVERMVGLTKIMSEWQPDVAVSFSSPECARVAYGLGIPHICCNDSPHAESVARLSLPLATLLASPWIIPFRVWAAYGIKRRQWRPYRALDPAAWLKSWSFNKVSSQLGLDPGEYIVFRPEPTDASHLKARDGRRLAIIRELCRRFQEYRIVVLPRYEWQVDEAKKLGLANLLVLEEPVLAPDLLIDAAMFIGMGGTMCAEAALLGVPVLSLYPDKATYVDRYLERMGLMERVESLTGLAARVEEVLKDEEARRHLRLKAKRVLEGMEDPTVKLKDLVFSLA
jgi:predicted glycosyltransferase